MSKFHMTKCGDCVYWNPDVIEADDVGACCVNPPVVLMDGTTRFPVTGRGICCADAWDGETTEQQKAAEAYFKQQMADIAPEKMDS